MSTRAEDQNSLFRQFLSTLSRIPPTSSPEHLDRLARLQKVLVKEESLVAEPDLVKREKLVREYEDELKKSSKQSQSVDAP